METRRLPTRRGFAGKALAVPLSIVLAAGCAPSAAYAGEDAGAGLQPTALAAAGAKIKAASASLYSVYRPVLVRAVKATGEFERMREVADGDQWAPEYFLFDLTQDGNPELMVRMNLFNDTNLVYVFTSESGSAVQLGQYWEYGGESAGNSSGQLFAICRSDVYAYVNEITLNDSGITSTLVKVSKSTEGEPNADTQMITEFLESNGAQRLAATDAGDYSVLSSETKIPLSKATVSVDSGGVYTGAAKTPAVTVKIDDEKLVQGLDYKVSYRNNTNAGTAVATVTGEGDYQGAVDSNFTIERASLATSALSVAQAGAYTGAAKTPAVAATLAGKKLVQGVDYTVSYANNRNAGTATATITGKGNYQGSRAAGFAIGKASNTMSAKALSKTVKHSNVAKSGQKVHAVSFAKKAQGKVTYKNVSTSAPAKKFSVNSSTGAITVKKGTAKGAYSVKVQVHADGNGNYNASTQTVKAKVTVK